MLQVIFGDDEHTAADGPYQRALKTRKWLYLSAGVLLILSAGLYKPEEATKILKVVSLPETALLNAAGLAFAYLVVQYLLLCLQLFSAYDIILSDRFIFRRAEELSLAREKVSEAGRAYDQSLFEVRNAFVSDEAGYLGNLAREAGHLEKMIGQGTGLRDYMRSQGRSDEDLEPHEISIAEMTAKREQLLSKKYKLERNGFASMTFQEEASVVAAKSVLDEVTASLKSLEAQVPSARKWYKESERAIDLFRIVPPVIMAGWVAIHVMRATDIKISSLF